MTDSCRKVSRGQVWFLVDNDVPLVHTQGSIQGKNRPWLVVSNNSCNQSSPVYTVVPLTTAPKNELPTHVTFQTGDKTQTIMCEQIRSISKQAFFNSGSYYMWQMSEKYMNLVDEALAIQLGIQIVFPNSDRYWESLSKLIRVKVKEAVEHSKVDAIDIGKVATLLEQRVTSIVNDTVAPTLEPEPTPVVTTVEPEPVKRDRISWTTEAKKAFLEDYDNLGSRATAEKYQVKIGSVYGMRFKFFKELYGGGNHAMQHAKSVE